MLRVVMHGVGIQYHTRALGDEHTIVREVFRGVVRRP